MANATVAAEPSVSNPRRRARATDIRGLSIRATLFLLTGLLSILLIGATGLHLQSVLHDYRLAGALEESKSLRDGLLTSSALLSAERQATFAFLSGAPDADPAKMADARAAVDALRRSAEADIRAGTTRSANSDNILELTVAFGQQLELLREQADDALAQRPDVAAGAAQAWFVGASALVGAIQSIRIALLSREEPVDAEFSALGLLRYYLGIAGEAQAQNVILIDAARLGAVGSWWLDIAQRNAGRLALAWQLVSEQLAAPLEAEIGEALGNAIATYETFFGPSQGELLDTLSRGEAVPEERALAWLQAVELANAQQEGARALLLSAMTEAIDEYRATLLKALIGWIVLTIVGLLAAVASVLVIRNRVILPLENLRVSMLRLANNDLDAPVFHLHRVDEVAAMTDALRVFKANAIRRQRMQVEREELNAQLRSAYSTLKADLEAAAVVQQAILPSASQFDGVSIHQLFLASSVVAGDTFNVLKIGGGRLIFFHVDVSGHGAAAALVSMASHHVLTRAAQRLTAGVPLSEVVATVNSEWPESLPYFTMIYGFIDVEAGIGRLVQAGHPPPYVIDESGSVQTVGEGGVPIGLLPGSSFEVTESSFSFRPGDRLVLHSDGIIDAMSPAEERFSEERLDDLVRRCAGMDSSGLLAEIDRAVRAWRGSNELEDDISVVIVERSGKRVANEHR